MYSKTPVLHSSILCCPAFYTFFYSPGQILTRTLCPRFYTIFWWFPRKCKIRVLLYLETTETHFCWGFPDFLAIHSIVLILVLYKRTVLYARDICYLAVLCSCSYSSCFLHVVICQQDCIVFCKQIIKKFCKQIIKKGSDCYPE